ncbi:MAG: type II secretion system F family protein [Zhongshania sp.]|uniref:type II secretion system F family protein n=1 Tax=Zhongshania sp. TaxID=1971902 RepID=UPI00261A7446|nr:type II secretion system F family protein [Zhongshania sp.]MDF1691042.1 type II secretion system F family protein [Zhongshania sp.]
MLWIALALLLVGLAFVVLMISSESNEPTPEDEIIPEVGQKLPPFLENYLGSNGVELPPSIVYAGIAITAAGIAVSLLALPAKINIISAIAVVVVALSLVKIIGAQRRAKMLDQLPSFINQVTRRLSAGVSVENAFADSVETLERPLGTVMRRVVRRVHFGYDLHQAFEREARVNKLNEFDVLATALRINEQYGGSIRSILDDIVDILRMQDSGKRELSAMTGETRVTAAILAALPPGIAAYTFYNNPKFLTDMWQDAGGQQTLIAAVIMQLLGVIVLWRMIKTIGN